MDVLQRRGVWVLPTAASKLAGIELAQLPDFVSVEFAAVCSVSLRSVRLQLAPFASSFLLCVRFDASVVAPDASSPVRSGSFRATRTARAVRLLTPPEHALEWPPLGAMGTR